MPVSDLLAPACVPDHSTGSAADPDFLLETQRVLDQGERYGRIPAGSWVLLRTDWSARQGAAYADLAEDGAHVVADVFGPETSGHKIQRASVDMDIPGVPQTAIFNTPCQHGPDHYRLAPSGR